MRQPRSRPIRWCWWWAASPEVGLADARKMVADGVAALVPYARQHGVKLGLEPLHPMYAAERSVLVTIGQALELASAYTPQEVGLVLDVFHIWWDPQVLALIAQSSGQNLRLPCQRLAGSPARPAHGQGNDGRRSDR